MNDVDYARIHYDVAVKVWRDAPRWTPLFPDYVEYTERFVDAASIALDNAIAESISGPRPARVVPVWLGVEGVA